MNQNGPPQDVEGQPARRWEIFAAAAILAGAFFLLTIRYWEPGAESWKYWSSARILWDTGQFPGLDRGPLYVVYLLPFRLLPYPLSITAEFWATHLFCGGALFFMLRSFLRFLPALFLTCAWVPTVSVIEGNSTLAGLGFLALYLRGLPRADRSSSGFPPSLVAAALCRTAYYPFLLGHILGVLFERLWTKRRLLELPNSPKVFLNGRVFLNAGFAALVALTMIFLSPDWDRQRMEADPTYVPFPLEGADGLTIAFFQWGDFDYATRHSPPSQWSEKDWYFTQREAYGDAKTMWEAFVKRPDTVLANLRAKIPQVGQLPMTFFAGRPASHFVGFLIAALSWLLVALSAWTIVRRSKANGSWAGPMSVLAGTGATVLALALTNFSRRWVMALLPIGLLAVVFAGPGFHSLAKTLLERRRFWRVLGGALAAAGIGMNPWLLSRWFSPDGAISFPMRAQVVGVELLLVAIGTSLMFRPDSPRILLKRKPSWYAGAFAVLSSVGVLWNSSFLYPEGWKGQIRALRQSVPLLDGGEDGFSMKLSTPALLDEVKPGMKILALEDLWLKSFTRLDPKDAQNVLSLPPFADPTGEVEEWLGDLDAIWVSRAWSTEGYSLGTQMFLRYRLHVAPFLEKALKQGWTVREIETYGRVYRRPETG